MLLLSKSNLDVLKENTPGQTSQVPGRLLLNSPCCFPGGRRVHPGGVTDMSSIWGRMGDADELVRP